MKIRTSRAWTLLVLAGCGGTLWPAVTTTTLSSPRNAIECATDQVTRMGYYLVSTDERTRLDARKEVADQRHRAYFEYRKSDELAVRASGAGDETTLRIEARSFSERMTRRGPTRSDEYASERVQADARALANKCGGETAPSETAPDETKTPRGTTS